MKHTLVAFLASLAGALPFAAAQTPTAPGDQVSDEQLEANWIQSRINTGDSHASGARPELGPTILGNPSHAAVVLRVGLYYPSFNTSGGVSSEFSTLHHPFVQISGTVDTVHVIDRASGRLIAVMHPGTIVDVRHDGAGFIVSEAGQALETVNGPVLFRPTTRDERLRVESIRRANILGSGFVVPSYRGAIEIARGAVTPAERVNVVNVIELESYVPGVVVNESPAFFHVEALKAQAVAARGYAVANVGRFARSGFPFDIVDSSSSQVYRGVIAEHAKAVQASAETLGLVAQYHGRIVSALYSSSFGGHSENNEWIFPSPSSALPGLNAEPYLRGTYDGDGPPPLFGDDASVAAFWQAVQPATFDDCVRAGNRFSRWKVVLPATVIKSRLPGRSTIVAGSPSTALTGSITDVQVLGRMSASARAAVVRVDLTTGAAEVRGWDNLRFVFGRTSAATAPLCGTSTIAANFTLNNPSVIELSRDAAGLVSSVTSWGGGWGHNVGLSQFGAHGRGRAGQTFLQILKAYYTGVGIGAYPIDIGREPGSGPPTLRQQFYAPDVTGTLEVRANGMKGLRVVINDAYDIKLDEASLASGVVRIDVSPYLTPGVNVIQYVPVGRRGTATVSVIVE